MRPGSIVPVLVMMAGFLSPAHAQTAGDAEWDRLRAEWDPAADDVRILVGLAGVAADARDLPRYHAFVDTVVRADDAHAAGLKLAFQQQPRTGVRWEKSAHSMRFGQRIHESALHWCRCW